MKLQYHSVKIKLQYADAILNGLKTAEIRYNDRNYKEGDLVSFIPIDEDGNSLIDNELAKHQYQITYVINGYGLKPGWIVWCFKEVADE